MGGLFIAVLSISATVVAAIIGAAIPIIYKLISARKLKRVIPTVAVWNNRSDNIDERLKNNSLRWFINLDELGGYTTGENKFYLVVRSENKYKLSESKVEINLEIWDNHGNPSKQSKPYAVGMITTLNGLVFPVSVSGKKVNVDCIIKYKTESNENMQYQVEFTIDVEQGLMSERLDSSCIIRKDKRKYVKYYNFKLSESYTSNEVKAKLKDKSLNANVKGNDQNGNNN